MASLAPPITVTEIADGFHVTIHGAIHLNREPIEAELRRLEGMRPRVIELDLSDSEHISSVGFSVLVPLNTRLKAVGAQLIITKIQVRTRQLFKTLHLEKLFVFASDAVIDNRLV